MRQRADGGGLFGWAKKFCHYIQLTLCSGDAKKGANLFKVRTHRTGLNAIVHASRT